MDKTIGTSAKKRVETTSLKPTVSAMILSKIDAKTRAIPLVMVNYIYIEHEANKYSIWVKIQDVEQPARIVLLHEKAIPKYTGLSLSKSFVVNNKDTELNAEETIQYVFNDIITWMSDYKAQCTLPILDLSHIVSESYSRKE